MNTFDPASQAGSVVLDDGLVLPFAAKAFASSGLRLLRPGQRLGVTVSDDGGAAHITSLWLEGVGFVPAREHHSGRPRS